MTGFARIVVLLGIALAAAAPGAVAAQKPPPPAAKGPPNAVQGFSQNRDQPVQIEALRLEVRDKDKIATFSGDVQVVQGDTQMRCKVLVVFYEAGGSGPTTTSVTPAGGAGGTEQRIKKLEARGGVVVTQNDQIATGDHAVFDMASNTVTLAGNVVVTQGQNVLRGDRLIVDMSNGVSRVESGKAGEGRVQGLFLPGSGGAPAPGLPANPLKPDNGAKPDYGNGKPASRVAPGRPLQLN